MIWLSINLITRVVVVLTIKPNKLQESIIFLFHNFRIKLVIYYQFGRIYSLALVIAATVVLVVTSFSVDVIAKVESGKELNKIRNREIRSGQECDTNQVDLQDNTTNTTMSG